MALVGYSVEVLGSQPVGDAGRVSNAGGIQQAMLPKNNGRCTAGREPYLRRPDSAKKLVKGKGRPRFEDECSPLDLALRPGPPGRGVESPDPGCPISSLGMAGD